MICRKIFQLRVNHIEKKCTFELTWGTGQSLYATLDYPQILSTSYQKWQKAYLNYYKDLRGKIKFKGSVTEPYRDRDSRFSLVQAEAQLLSQFHDWLRRRELYDLRAILKSATKDSVDQQSYWVDIFLTFNSLELQRLPWEAWEIGTDFSGGGKFRFARKPANIRHEPINTSRKTGKARVLAILGNNENINLKDDIQALQKLSGLIYIKFVGWKPGKSKTKLKTEIIEAITDKNGWDVLFFAGHSNETKFTGGELNIAPNASISVSEIEQPIRQAKENGLQFALFNSCSGINIAQSLINLGLSQVAVMREPIHDLVAQEFLAKFLESLAAYRDVHEALLDACYFLKQDKSYTYPSSYLIPSLFCNPEAELFQIKCSGVKHKIKRWLPTKLEVVSLTTFIALSLLSPVQDLLLEPRILLQSIYRYLTVKEYNSEAKAPILLIEVDEESINKTKLKALDKKTQNINYGYLADIVDELGTEKAKVLGINYILDRYYNQLDKNIQLKKSLDKLVEKQTNIIFAVDNQTVGEISPDMAGLDLSMEGDVNFSPWFMKLPNDQKCLVKLYGNQNYFKDKDIEYNCPFAYLVALSHEQRTKEASPNLFGENLSTEKNLSYLIVKNLKKYLFQEKINQSVFLKELDELSFHPISKQLSWFQPIVDFSIPPEQVYERKSSFEFLENQSGTNNSYGDVQKSIVLIGAGGYRTIEGYGDNLTIPLAVHFWRRTSSINTKSEYLTGSEVNAYMIHHLLNQRLVIPIPDFLMILLAALLGKGMAIVLLDNREQQEQWVRLLGCATVVYALVGLQVYISSGLLLPLLLPSTVFWNYIRVATGCKN